MNEGRLDEEMPARMSTGEGKPARASGDNKQRQGQQAETKQETARE